MANQGQQTERDMLSCGICTGLLKEPKTLACMHRFCERCLKDHIITVTAKGTGSRPGFSCPECREFIPAPGNSSIPSTWASLLKTDFVIQSLVEVHQLQQEVSVPTVSHPCPKHRDKEQELYCFDCSVTVCHLCAVISHRACRKIGTVAEAAQQRRATWQENTRQISGLIFEARNIEKTRDRNMKAVANKKSCVEVEIRQAAERMRQAVTGEEKKLIHEVQTNYDALQQHDLKFWEYIINLETLEANVVTKLASSSDFDLIADSGVSDTLDTCRIESVVTNGDYQRYYENLQVVQYSFQPHSTPSLSPGKVQFLWHAPGYDGSDFPAPSCWQPSTSVEWQPSTSAASNSEPWVPSTSAASNSEPSAPSTSVAYNSEPRAPVTPVAYNSEPQAPLTSVASNSEPQAPSTSVAYNSEPGAPSTSDAFNSEPRAPSTSTAYNSEPRAPSTSVASNSEPRAPSTSVASNNEPRAENIVDYYIYV